MTAWVLTVGSLLLAGWHVVNAITWLMPWVSRRHAWFAVIHLAAAVSFFRAAWTWGAS